MKVRQSGTPWVDLHEQSLAALRREERREDRIMFAAVIGIAGMLMTGIFSAWVAGRLG